MAEPIATHELNGQFTFIVAWDERSGRVLFYDGGWGKFSYSLAELKALKFEAVPIIFNLENE